MFFNSLNIIFLNPRRFYFLGALCYLIVAFCHSITIIYNLKQGDIYTPSLISALFGNLFDYLIVSFLGFMYRSIPKPVKNPMKDDEIIKMLGDEKE